MTIFESYIDHPKIRRKKTRENTPYVDQNNTLHNGHTKWSSLNVLAYDGY